MPLQIPECKPGFVVRCILILMVFIQFLVINCSCKYCHFGPLWIISNDQTVFKCHQCAPVQHDRRNLSMLSKLSTTIMHFKLYSCYPFNSYEIYSYITSLTPYICNLWLSLSFLIFSKNQLLFIIFFFYFNRFLQWFLLFIFFYLLWIWLTPPPPPPILGENQEHLLEIFLLYLYKHFNAINFHPDMALVVSNLFW